ncbi:3-isopropylmalate dehydratase small subunit [Halomicronema hongdechloris C2206]|uniref:3-isopropylmalate dehydratase n=1 Tax=Halomicronema hongdechloris C2206 TaxID=1641165 RepID=A0A1Z3HN35_9CYAN|nr:3-isopropylmalate dehydratase small subunit [Halomicronema hongdechloris]ASC71685.1 3-isopropylmalate dehydratase small subunit [Halomicronema hongdechloris C2206]
MAQAVASITGQGIPLQGDDIDTDRIIPARFLRCTSFDGLGEQVFADDRASTQGQHPFDQPQFQAAKILVVNRNFGCGSSREHAPQAIARWGITALVGESFAEIFFGNCVAMGIPCVTAPTQAVRQLQQAISSTPDLSLQLNLDTLQLQYGDTSLAVSLPEGARKVFLEGNWDACAQLVAQAEAIRATAANLPYLQWGRLSA